MALIGESSDNIKLSSPSSAPVSICKFSFAAFAARLSGPSGDMMSLARDGAWVAVVSVSTLAGAAMIAAEYPVSSTLELGDYAICFSFTEIDVQKIAACNAR